MSPCSWAEQAGHGKWLAAVAAAGALRDQALELLGQYERLFLAHPLLRLGRVRRGGSGGVFGPYCWCSLPKYVQVTIRQSSARADSGMVLIAASRRSISSSVMGLGNAMALLVGAPAAGE